jgi:hypothetical protein
LLNGKCHAVAFNKALEAGSINTGKMNENVWSIFLLDETKAFFLIEPLNGSICHSDFFSFQKILLVPNFRLPLGWMQLRKETGLPDGSGP